jgi:hypothetical protein
MGKAVRVFAWCDPHGEAAGIEATHLDVPLQWGKIIVSLDLCDEHHKDADQFLLLYTGAGTRQGYANPGRKRGKRPDSYYTGLREWAEARGTPVAKTGDGKKYSYPDELRRLYDAHLLQEGAGDGDRA